MVFQVLQDFKPAQLAGTVKWYSTQAGFGYIQRDDGLEDIFVTQAEVQTSGMAQLYEGQKITFEVCTDKIQPRAIMIRPA